MVSRGAHPLTRALEKPESLQTCLEDEPSREPLEDVPYAEGCIITLNSVPCPEERMIPINSIMPKDIRSELARVEALTRSRVPVLSRCLFLKAACGILGAGLVCGYSVYRIIASDADFNQLQRNNMEYKAAKLLGQVGKQVTTSVSSTKAIAALVQLDAGRNLIAPLNTEVQELVGAAEKLAALASANASQEEQDAAASRKSAAASAVIRNSSSLGFNVVAQSLILSYMGITNLQLAPGGVVSLIHPLSGHEGAIGHDLFFDPDRRAGALLTIASRRAIFVGPVVLLQNGLTAIIARFPVFMLDPQYVGPLSTDPSWYGFATMLTTLDDLFSSTELDQDPAYVSYVLYSKKTADKTFIRASTSIPGQPKHLSDDPDKLWLHHAEKQDPVEAEFNDVGLNIHWVLLLWPSEGWKTTSDVFGLQIALCALFTFASLGNLYGMLVRDSVIREVSKYCSNF